MEEVRTSERDRIVSVDQGERVEHENKLGIYCLPSVHKCYSNIFDKSV